VNLYLSGGGLGAQERGSMTRQLPWRSRLRQSDVEAGLAAPTTGSSCIRFHLGTARNGVMHEAGGDVPAAYYPPIRSCTPILSARPEASPASFVQIPCRAGKRR